MKTSSKNPTANIFHIDDGVEKPAFADKLRQIAEDRQAGYSFTTSFNAFTREFERAKAKVLALPTIVISDIKLYDDSDGVTRLSSINDVLDFLQRFFQLNNMTEAEEPHLYLIASSAAPPVDCDDDSKLEALSPMELCQLRLPKPATELQRIRHAVSLNAAGAHSLEKFPELQSLISANKALIIDRDSFDLCLEIAGALQKENPL